MTQLVKAPELFVTAVALVTAMAWVGTLAQELLHTMGRVRKKKRKKVLIFLGKFVTPLPTQRPL